jgi:CrcB protein
VTGTTLRTIVAVAAGGLFGTAARLGIDALLPHERDAFPWSTLTVNVVGSLALGFLVARVWPIAPDWLRAGLGAGVLGSFTTFSAVAVAVIELPPATATVYLAVSVLLGLGGALLGLRLGRRPEASTPTTIDPVNE